MEQTTSHKIGVLIPQSNTYPLMGKSFVNGLKLGLGDLPCEYFIESIGLGADPKQLLNSYQKLSFQNGVALTTGLLGHYGLPELANFASQNEEILLTADLGAKKPIQTPNGVFQNSLGLYDSLKALVNHFPSINVQQIASSTCYYESGYDFVEALSSTMESIGNVEFAGHFITPLEPRENETELMEQTLKAINPDAIVAFHNGVYAKEHAQFLTENGIHSEYPIYALPFSGETALIQEFPTIFEKIKIVSSWFEELDNEINKHFCTSYRKNYNKTPDFFALLGYENGLIIKAALSQTDCPLQDALAQSKIEGPRGPIDFQEKLNRTKYKNYLWELSPQQTETPLKKIIADLDLIDLDLAQIQSPNEQQGWYNAYLCH